MAFGITSALHRHDTLPALKSSVDAAGINCSRLTEQKTSKIWLSLLSSNEIGVVEHDAKAGELPSNSELLMLQLPIRIVVQFS